MPITDHQKSLMQNHIGASLAAKVLNISKWGNAADAFWYLTEGIGTKAGQAADIGNTLEPSILDWAGRELGVEMVRNQRRTKGVLRATHDALVKVGPAAIQAKSCGILRPEAADEWGEPGTDEIPQEHIVQCQVEMHVSDLDYVWVPALIVYRGFVMYRVNRDQEAIDAIVGECQRFWDENVLTKTPPPEVPNIEVLKKLRRVEGKRIEVGHEFAEVTRAWDVTRDRRLGLEKGEEALCAGMIAEMGDAEIAVLPDGREFTYLEQKGAPRCDFAALKSDGLYDKYVTQGTHRVARIRKGRQPP